MTEKDGRKYDADGNPYVIITIDAAPEGDEDMPEVFGIDGVNYAVPRGVPVEVPMAVAECWAEKKRMQQLALKNQRRYREQQLR